MATEEIGGIMLDIANLPYIRINNAFILMENKNHESYDFLAESFFKKGSLEIPIDRLMPMLSEIKSSGAIFVSVKYGGYSDEGHLCRLYFFNKSDRTLFELKQ